MKEKRVYVIDMSQTDFEFRKYEKLEEYDKIREKAEELGTVYSLEYFQDQINDEQLFLNNSFILID